MSKKMTQRERNPFKNSDSNKRYYTYDYYQRRTFGGKCAKVPIDAGFTCPNIDGRCGYGGCIYCSGRGSGDFAESAALSVSRQIELTREKLRSKWSDERIIPYFQAHTNTYAPTEILREKFCEALEARGVVGLNIATRADCLEDGTVELLSELSEKTVLTVELGLQTSNDDTARIINRGHSFEDFVRGYERLRRANRKINICVHLIFGLPGESMEDMLRTVRDVSALHPDQVKLHLLHVIEGTPLAKMYKAGKYQPMEQDDYVRVVVDALTLLPENTVVGRLTGDGMQSSLLAPDWSRKKTVVINEIDKLMYAEGLWQGCRYNCSEIHLGDGFVKLS